MEKIEQNRLDYEISLLISALFFFMTRLERILASQKISIPYPIYVDNFLISKKHQTLICLTNIFYFACFMCIMPINNSLF